MGMERHISAVALAAVLLVAHDAVFNVPQQVQAVRL